MLLVGLAVEDAAWAILVAIPEIIIGALCLRKTPSEDEVAANRIKKQELTSERDALQKQLNALN